MLMRLRMYRLQNKVIDLEVAAATPSPTIEPSVHTVLLGHSMGGIVAAETLLAVASDMPIPFSPASSYTGNASQDLADAPPTFIFPHIVGIVAFDTPYLGISPGVVAHGAEKQYRAASSAWTTVGDMASSLGVGGAAAKFASRDRSASSSHQNTNDPSQSNQPTKLLTSPVPSDDAAATPAWQRWGKYAMFAGAAGAVAAGGAAAYLKRDTISEGWGWIGSHLEFVGCLAKGEELRSRMDKVGKLERSGRVGFRDLITVLGKGAGVDNSSLETSRTLTGGGDNSASLMSLDSVTGSAKNDIRTFCNLPSSSSQRQHSGHKNQAYFEIALNDRASHETEAHMEMFDRKRNPGYYALAHRVRELVVEWVDMGDWYTPSSMNSRQAPPHIYEHTDSDDGETEPTSETNPLNAKEKDDEEDDDDEMVDVDLDDGHEPREGQQNGDMSLRSPMVPGSGPGHGFGPGSGSAGGTPLIPLDEEDNVWAGDAPVMVEKQHQTHPQ